MFNVNTLIKQIQHNCNISDAHYAGNYSLCTYLLKMREYYRWEANIPMSYSLSRDTVGKWLTQREQMWDEIEEHDYSDLLCDSEQIDPYNNHAVNQHSLQHGYVYSSGRGLFNKPHFFLGELVRKEYVENLEIFISGKELARDLVAPPAMLIGNQVYIRQESIRRFIWEKIEENRWRRLEESPVIQAANCYGTDIRRKDIDSQGLEALLDCMTTNETESALHHELGEAAAGQILQDNWNEMLMSIMGNKAEFIARAVRDHLADALCTLPWLIESNNEPSLHFYFGNFTGLRKLLFPEAQHAYQQWSLSGDKDALLKISDEAASRWQREAEQLLDSFTGTNPDDTVKYIEKVYAPRLGKAA